MQEAIVAVVVAYAAWTVMRRYLPAALKRNVRAVLGRLLKQAGWERAANRLEKPSQSAASCADGCGSCGGCDSKAADLSRTEFAIAPKVLRRNARR